MLLQEINDFIVAGMHDGLEINHQVLNAVANLDAPFQMLRERGTGSFVAMSALTAKSSKLPDKGLNRWKLNFLAGLFIIRKSG